MATAALLPPPRSVFFDANGNPLAGGLVHTYVPGGGTTPQTSWEDSGEVTANSNPIVLDAAGSCLLYGAGSYQLTVTDALGNPIPAYCGVTVGAPVKSGTFQVSVADFGAVADGMTDATTAIQAAIASLTAGGTLLFQPGVYVTSAALSIPVSGITLAGAGTVATVIKINVGGVPVIAIAGYLTGVVVRDMTIDRSVAATAGGNGINDTISSNTTRFANLIIQHQWVGLALGPTAYSLVENCVVQNNLNIGFLLQNTATNGALQWSFLNCLAQANGAQGWLVTAVAGAGSISVGEFTACSSFANSGTGFTAIGLASCPIYGVRITGGFFGNDGNHEVYLDTHGGEHKINGLFTEQAGIIMTGPTLSTAISHAGSGFFFTANNIDVQLTGCYAEGHSLSGFTSYAGEVMFSGCKAISNGFAAVAGDQAGFNIPAGRASFGTIRAGNIGGTPQQQYGLQLADGTAGHLICGGDLTGNTTAPMSIVNPTNTTIVGVVPGQNYLQPFGNVQLGDGGLTLSNGSIAMVGGIAMTNGNLTLANGGIVVGTASGGATNGVVNAAAGIEKNGVGYTSP